MKTSKHIVAAMKHHNIVIALFMLLTGFGIWSLPRLNKDEFPQFTIRQGIVAAVYPGATAMEVEEQVTMPLEDYINSFEEVDKSLTFSRTEDGMAYIYVMIRNSVADNAGAWTKMQHLFPPYRYRERAAQPARTGAVCQTGLFAPAYDTRDGQTAYHGATDGGDSGDN